MIDKISQLINEYYIDPILHDSGYNIVNTVTWAIILGICIFGIVKLLRKMNVNITDRLTASVIPFILAGSSLRVIEDTGVLEPPISYLFITPNIYFLVFLITVIFLIIAKVVSKAANKGFETVFALLGSAWFVVNIAYLLYLEDIVRPWVPIFVIASAGVLLYLIYLIFRRSGSEIFTNRLNLSILGVHLLDASSTFAGVDFLGYYEKHVVPALLIDLTGTALVMYPLKLLIFLPVIYILDTQFEEDEDSKTLKTFLKLVIIMLGLAPACRNTIRMMLGV
ncbi:DUF63 family protein [Methanolobus chelungpuianus]|uniref:DUF63 domain-containing protein n=1 Tax=Methanolobus chelungpuianus TaxID=502115 RepID=A0AAE3KVZ7_9EURY|nr:DUF63 family protein [Methanolobus chelungpuianus]MCQ6962150.1 hypothetical protein [Methanolobus chelungpuianus]